QGRFNPNAGLSFSLITERANRTTDVLMQRVGLAEIAGARGLMRPPSAGQTVMHAQLQKVVNDGRSLARVVQSGVAGLRTDLDDFSPLLVQLLIYQGFCAARGQFEGTNDKQGILTLPPDSAYSDGWSPAPRPTEVASEKLTNSLNRESANRYRLWRV